jgi:hypothetical protein
VALNRPSPVTIVLSNPGTVSWELTGFPVSGAGFAVTGPGTSQLGPSQSLTLNAIFTPTIKGPVEGVLNLQLHSPNLDRTVTFFLDGTGLAAQFICSYTLNPTGNQIAIDDGGLIQFLPTLVGSSNTATFTIINQGNGTGTVRLVSLPGDVFRLSGVPLLPLDIDPQKQVSFVIIFQPTTADKFQGALTVQLDTVTKKIALAGQGQQAQLTYEISYDSQTFQAQAGGTFTFPDTQVGGKKQSTVVVRNAGNAPTQVSAVSVQGTSFQGPGPLPPPPIPILPGGALQFTITFSPTGPGLQTGTLLVDGTVINLVGKGIGPALVFSVMIGSTVTPLANNGTVVFPNTNVGGQSVATIQAVNSGNADASINNITVTGPGFSRSGELVPPATIAAAGKVTFDVYFQPLSVGVASGTLQVDTLVFPLKGTADPPQILPGVNFTGLPATVAPFDQPSMGLSLSAGYSLDLVGKLNLTFTSDSFVDDPAIQFATGGRTVDFRIPANTTDAIFSQNQKVIQFQAGTVAGTIGIQATIGTGAVDLTPSPAPSRSVVIPGNAPLIQSLVINARTQSSITLFLTGFSTPRSVGQMSFHFQPLSGYSLQATDLSSDVSTAFSTWYQSAASQPFGSQFSVSFQVAAVAGDINGVQSLTVTMSNGKGVSNPQTIALK